MLLAPSVAAVRLGCNVQVYGGFSERWSQDKVAQVLAGESPLTLETVFAVAQSLGYTFDVVLRKKEAPRVPQPWERTL